MAHPSYVDILMHCVRESFIAYMGKFDELEFCLWLVAEVDYHGTAFPEDCQGEEVSRNRSSSSSDNRQNAFDE